MLVFGGVEDALAIPEQIFPGLVADGSIEVNIFCYFELLCQIFELFEMLYVLFYFTIVPSCDH